MKDVIKDQLPLKTDRVVLCPLTESQLTAYKNCLNCHDVYIILTHKEPCECGRLDKKGDPFSKGNCCHKDWNMVSWITCLSDRKLMAVGCR